MDTKERARYLVQSEVNSGRKPKATSLQCAHCENMASHYHHPDYDKPLEVIPLCTQCHGMAHRTAAETKICAFRLDVPELVKLDILVKASGLNQSEVIRQLIDTAMIRPPVVAAFVSEKDKVTA